MASKRLRDWPKIDVPKVEAFRKIGAAQLEDLSVMEKVDLMADFSLYTTAKISNAQGWAAFNGSKRIGRLST